MYFSSDWETESTMHGKAMHGPRQSQALKTGGLREAGRGSVDKLPSKSRQLGKRFSPHYARKGFGDGLAQRLPKDRQYSKVLFSPKLFLNLDQCF
jgi:hypothetical protein